MRSSFPANAFVATTCTGRSAADSGPLAKLDVAAVANRNLFPIFLSPCVVPPTLRFIVPLILMRLTSFYASLLCIVMTASATPACTPRDYRKLARMNISDVATCGALAIVPATIVDTCLGPTSEVALSQDCVDGIQTQIAANVTSCTLACFNTYSSGCEACLLGLFTIVAGTLAPPNLDGRCTNPGDDQVAITTLDLGFKATCGDSNAGMGALTCAGEILGISQPCASCFDEILSGQVPQCEAACSDLSSTNLTCTLCASMGLVSTIAACNAPSGVGAGMSALAVGLSVIVLIAII